MVVLERREEFAFQPPGQIRAVLGRCHVELRRYGKGVWRMDLSSAAVIGRLATACASAK